MTKATFFDLAVYSPSRAFYLDPTDCPWVSEDGLYTVKSKKVALVTGIWAYRRM